MKKILLLSISILMFVSCSKDDDKSTSVTSATIILKNTSGQPVEGITVYSYSEDSWEVEGDNSFFSNQNVVSNAEGKSTFSNLEYTGTFFPNENQETYRFSAHYSLGGVNKKKAVGMTFNKGENKTINITID